MAQAEGVFMRPARIVLGLVSAALLLPGMAWAGHGPPANFEQAKAEADAHGKLLLVDFYTDW